MGMFGRKVHYQRVLVNQTLTASQVLSLVMDLGFGARAIQIGWNSVGAIQPAIYGCDHDASPLQSNGSLGSGQQSTRASYVFSEFGGARYMDLVIIEKSGLANTINYVDVWWTNE